MKTTPGQRLKQFRTSAQLETSDLEAITGISKSLIEKMEAGAAPVSDKTARTLKEKCQLPIDWLMTGGGEMRFELIPVNPYRDYALKRLEGEVQFLRGLLNSLAGQKANFRQALDRTGFRKRRLSGAAA